MQTYDVINSLLRHIETHSLVVVTCIGGVNKLDENLSEISDKKPNVVIATPGRLDDLIRRSPLVQAGFGNLIFVSFL